jgi:hypothetical protein
LVTGIEVARFVAGNNKISVDLGTRLIGLQMTRDACSCFSSH